MALSKERKNEIIAEFATKKVTQVHQKYKWLC